MSDWKKEVLDLLVKLTIAWGVATWLIWFWGRKQ